MDYKTLFWSKVEKGSGCWIWQGRVSRNGGYGQFVVRAHRLSVELTSGPIPEGLVVLHLCDNPRCVRPDHLRVGTSKENTQDAIAKGRWTQIPPSAIGENNPRAKLTSSQVKEIRAKFRPRHYTYEMLAKEYGISTSHAKAILRGRCWKEPETTVSD